MAEKVFLIHKDWDKPKSFPKAQALKILKNQKHPTTPKKFRNDWKRVSAKGEPLNEDGTPLADVNQEQAAKNEEKGTTTGGNKKTTGKGGKR